MNVTVYRTTDRDRERRAPVLLLLMTVAVAACDSGGGDSDTDTDEATTDPIASAGDVRVRTETTEFLADDRATRTQTYEYDASGRIASRTLADAGDGTTQVVTYQYDDAGRLLTKTDGTDTDSYTYEDGRLVRAERVEGGVIEYRYDERGRLSGATGEAFFYDDDCVAFDSLAESLPRSDFEVAYDGDVVARITATTENDVATVARDEAGRLRSITYSGECYEDQPQFDTFSYDDRGRVSGAIIEGTGFRSFVDEYTLDYAGDRLDRVIVEDIDRVTAETSVSTERLTYDPDGRIASITVSIDGVETGTVAYTYEDGFCEKPGTADPSRALELEAATLLSARSPALRCGYWADERDF